MSMPRPVTACTRRATSGSALDTPFTQCSTWPPLRPLAPLPRPRASRTTTRRSRARSARCHAVETPVSPPPTTATSAATRARSGAVRSAGTVSVTHAARLSSRAPGLMGSLYSTAHPLASCAAAMPQLGTSVHLCLKDLYAQDVVEMIDRETRKYEVESIEHPDHPDYA